MTALKRVLKIELLKFGSPTATSLLLLCQRFSQLNFSAKTHFNFLSQLSNLADCWRWHIFSELWSSKIIQLQYIWLQFKSDRAVSTNGKKGHQGSNMILLVKYKYEAPEWSFLDLVAAGSSVILSCSYRVTEGEAMDSIKWWEYRLLTSNIEQCRNQTSLVNKS